MLQKEDFPAKTRWVIIAIGTLAGLVCALSGGLIDDHDYAFYLSPLAIAFASVLAFTLYRVKDVKSWLCALLTLPFIALMTGWLRWNFPGLPNDDFHGTNFGASTFLLTLVMPFLAAFCTPSGQKADKYAFITGALWNNTFTLGVTAVMTGLFWLVLLLWSKLFSMIGITLFEHLFFDNPFFPAMATGAAVAAGIVFCRRLPGAAGLFRNLLTLAVSVLLPLHAVISLLFLACLPFTGLAIIPASVSAATLLLTMTLLMLAFSAMVGEKAPAASRWSRMVARLVLVAQWITPLLAALAGWALWLRIAEYGWTVDRVYGVALTLLALIGSLLLVSYQRRAWSQGAANMNSFIVLMLALTACGWFLLHTPVVDPLRITVNTQLARYANGKAKADEGDLYTLSNAGRRGKEALQMLKAHPQWLKHPVQQQAMLMQILGGYHEGTKKDINALQKSIPLRAGSEAPPESWWQAQTQYVDHTLSTCMVDSRACLIWMQDLNNDGTPEVLLYNRNDAGISVYTHQGNEWRQAGSVTLSQNAEKALRESMPKTVSKPWRDLEINGQRYPVQYYGFEGQ
ncbi:DUF4153 domain-containing protein [Kosakonia cowanii]|uniref:DUF4153 domain-containing protein n=1 Tax=Kosakonia cowanii TaxID=208223 RepID=UPI002896A827|nr:DUF4153 domain-containing protein [Kosakonia cowanii]